MLVPDQTARRSHHLHCRLDLDGNAPTLIGCAQDSTLPSANHPPVFILLSGPQGHARQPGLAAPQLLDGVEAFGGGDGADPGVHFFFVLEKVAEGGFA